MMTMFKATVEWRHTFSLFSPKHKSDIFVPDLVRLSGISTVGVVEASCPHVSVCVLLLEFSPGGELCVKRTTFSAAM